MSDFSVQGEFRLIDRFTAPASAIGSATSALATKFSAIRQKFVGINFGLTALTAGMGYAAHRLINIRSLLSTGIDDLLSERRFKDMFERSAGAASIGMEKLHETIARVAKEGDLDMSDVLTPVSDTFLANAKLGGDHLIRAITATVDLVRERGQGTQEEIQATAELINKLMIAPERASRMLGQLGIAHDEKKSAELAKMLRGMSTGDAQNWILTEIEKKYGGRRIQDNLESNVRAFETAKQDLMETITSSIGTKLRDTLKSITSTLQQFTQNLKAGGKYAETFSNMVDRIGVAVSTTANLLTSAGGINTLLVVLSTLSTTVAVLIAGLLAIPAIFNLIPQSVRESTAAVWALQVALVAAAWAVGGPISGIASIIALCVDNWEDLRAGIEGTITWITGIEAPFQRIADMLGYVADKFINIAAMGITKINDFRKDQATPEELSGKKAAPGVGESIQRYLQSWLPGGTKAPEGQINVNITTAEGVTAKTSAIATGVQLKVGSNTAGTAGK